MLTALSARPQPTTSAAPAPASPAAGFLDLLKAAEAPPLDAPAAEEAPAELEAPPTTAPLSALVLTAEPDVPALPAADVEETEDAEDAEALPELSLYQLSMAALPEPAPVITSEAPPLSALTPPPQSRLQSPEDAPSPTEDGGEGSEPLPEAPASTEPAPAPAPAPAAVSADFQVMEPEARPASVRAAGAESLPPPAEVAVESGDEPQLQVKVAGLEKLSLRVQEGGDRIDVEIEKGVDRSLDVRVIAPPDAVDELSSMESELQRSLEERALKLGSYSMEARDPEADADADAEAGGEDGASEAESEAVAEHVWQLGLLNIRA